MQIASHKNTLHMDSRNFTVDGVDFEIIGTEIHDDGVCRCTVKNLSNNKMAELEHQKLCRMILEKQREVVVKGKSKNVNYRQLGIGI